MLPDLKTLSFCSSKITHLEFSSTDELLAVADESFYVSLCRYYHQDEDVSRTKEWLYVGRYRAHTQPITALRFNSSHVFALPDASFSESGITNQQGNSISAHAADKKHKRDLLNEAFKWEKGPRLFSVGADGRFNEFDVCKSWIRSGLQLKVGVDHLYTVACAFVHSCENY